MLRRGYIYTLLWHFNPPPVTLWNKSSFFTIVLTLVALPKLLLSLSRSRLTLLTTNLWSSSGAQCLWSVDTKKKHWHYPNCSTIFKQYCFSAFKNKCNFHTNCTYNLCFFPPSCLCLGQKGVENANSGQAWTTWNEAVFEKWSIQLPALPAT